MGLAKGQGFPGEGGAEAKTERLLRAASDWECPGASPARSAPKRGPGAAYESPTPDPPMGPAPRTDLPPRRLTSPTSAVRATEGYLSRNGRPSRRRLSPPELLGQNPLMDGAEGGFMGLQSIGGSDATSSGGQRRVGWSFGL